MNIIPNKVKIVYLSGEDAMDLADQIACHIEKGYQVLEIFEKFSAYMILELFEPVTEGGNNGEA